MRPGFFLHFALLALLLAPTLPSAPAWAQSRVQPLDRLLPQIRRAHPGEFYDAEGPLPGPDGSQHYHLKWLTPDGRVIWYDTDARTGRVLGMTPGRDLFHGPYGARAPYEGPAGPPSYDRGYEPRGYPPPGDFYGRRGYDRPYGGPYERRGFDGRGGRDHRH